MQAASPTKTDRELELEKGDELFLRNRNMTAKDWRKLDRQAKGESGYMFVPYSVRLTRVL
jgi:hypothetical protein